MISSWLCRRPVVVGVALGLMLASCAGGSTEGAAALGQTEAAEAAAAAAERAAQAAAAEAAEARAEAALAAARAEEDSAAAAAAEAARAEAESAATAARTAAEAVAEAAAAEAAEARAQAALAAARAEEDSAAVAAAEAALARAEADAEAAREAAVAAERAVAEAQAAVEEQAAAAAQDAEATQDQFLIGLDDVIIVMADPVVQADYAAEPYLGPEHAAGLLAFGGYLYRYGPDGLPVPDLAEDFPVFSEDGLTMTVTLRPDLVYSDGTPVVAQDAVVTLRRAKQGPLGTNLAAFDIAEAPDERTIVYRLRESIDCRIRTLACSEQMPLHPHAHVEADPEGYFSRPVSASQYVVVDWAPGSDAVVLEANPNYWRGPPAIQRLTLAASPEPLPRLLRLASGAAAVAVDIPPEAQADLPDDVEVVVHPTGGTYWFVIRSDAPGPLGDPQVRRALCLAADRQAINERAFLGTVEVTGAVLSRYRLGWEYEEILPLGRDLDSARELLVAAGHGDGFEITLQTRSSQPGWIEAASVLAENWVEIGVDADVQPAEDLVSIQNILSHDYDVMWAASGGDNLDTLRLLLYPGSFWSDSVAFADETVRAALDELTVAVATGDAETAQHLQTEIQRLALDAGVNYCPIAERTMLVGSRLPAGVLHMIPASSSFWIAPAAK